MSKGLRRQEGRKQLDSLLHRAAQINEEWTQRFTLDNPRFVDRYLYDGLRAFVVFELVGGTPKYLIAIFQRAQPVGWTKPNERHFGQLVSSETRHVELEEQLLEGSGCCEDGAMLVHNVELVENPKGIIPSSIRLEVCEDLESLISDPGLYLAYSRGLKIFPTRMNREGILPRGSVPIRLNELTDQEIESRAHVVDGISRNQTQLQRGIRANDYALDQVASIRIHLGDKVVRFGFNEPVVGGLEFVDMLLGPLDLGSRPNHTVIHGGDDD